MTLPKLEIGFKVIAEEVRHFGVGEVASYPDSDGHFFVDFYSGPVSRVRRKVSSAQRAHVEEQTRCFVALETGTRCGRVLTHRDGTIRGEPVLYHVAFPNEDRVHEVRETDFHVRSRLGDADPTETLAELAQESPFLFERRREWVEAYDAHACASRGLQSLDAARVELFPHQAEAVRRVLQDPQVRYLLADEVGLGKTIEAGAILKQIRRDAPGAEILIVVPAVLVGQWRAEMASRFDLTEVTVAAHDDLDSLVRATGLEVLVVDEAHRLVRGRGSEALGRLCGLARHLLLLSATPVLHRSADLLALLRLLDPVQYCPLSLDAFEHRITRRGPIGRLMLALSPTMAPVALRRQLLLLAKELADDEVVQAAIQAFPATTTQEHAAAWAELAMRVRIHVAETWRIHRRMVRTRRSSLMDNGELHQTRTLEPAEFASSYMDGAEFQRLWQWVEELRILAAARASVVGETEAKVLREDFLHLMQAASRPGCALVRIIETISEKLHWAFATDALNMVARAATDVPASSRLEALVAVLAYRPADEPRWVVFCGDEEEAEAVATYLRGAANAEVIVLAASCANDADAKIAHFRAYDGRVVLVCDRAAEEGLNLEAADGLVLFDLPFEPMRIEQRVGRLDRLNRTRPLQSIAILSTDDADDDRLAFDRAWYEVLVNGFRIFENSVADVPYLLEREMEHLLRLAFECGPTSLYGRATELATILSEERVRSEEQDAIDGTSQGAVQGTGWWKAIDRADSDEDTLFRSFIGYLTGSLALRVSYDESPRARSARPNAFVIQRDRWGNVLLPASRLTGLSGWDNRRLTFNRTLAVRDTDVKLLRPGHPLLDWLRSLADWDDRGRAFAMWRRVPGYASPRLVARVSFRVRLDAHAALAAWPGLGDVGRAALLRLATNWFAPWRGEVFLGADNDTASAEEVGHCRPLYDERRDRNLGGSRAATILSLMSATQWSNLCHRWADTAREHVRVNNDFVSMFQSARREASEWFAHWETQLRIRTRQDASPATAAEDVSLKTLRAQVASLLEQPRFEIDAMGAYILAADDAWVECG